MLNYIIIIIIAYLLGNISTSYIVAKQLSGVDIRTQGSGNAGSTNVLRTLGKKAGALTFIGDNPIPNIEPKDTYLVIATIIIKNPKHNSATTGFIPSIEPREVATPLPPLNPRNTG